MTILAVYGFENCANMNDVGLLANTSSSNTYGGSSIVSGRFGGHALSVGYDDSFKRMLVTPSGTVLVGFASKADWAYRTNASMFQFQDNDGSSQITFTVTSIGLMQVHASDQNGSVIGSGQIPGYSATNWYYFEIAATFGTSNVVQVWCEGTQIISLTGVKTNNGTPGNSTCSQVAWYETSTTNWQIDDIYIATALTDVQGPRRVQTLTPVAASGSPQWTPLSGTNVSNIEETTPDGDATYNSSATSGQTDLFTISALASNTTGVVFVQPVLLARKDDADTRLLSSVVQSGTFTATGAAASVNSTYQQLQADQLSTDPATSGSWTVAAVNALVVGYKAD